MFSFFPNILPTFQPLRHRDDVVYQPTRNCTPMVFTKIFVHGAIAKELSRTIIFGVEGCNNFICCGFIVMYFISKYLMRLSSVGKLQAYSIEHFGPFHTLHDIMLNRWLQLFVILPLIIPDPIHVEGFQDNSIVGSLAKLAGDWLGSLPVPILFTSKHNL